jgi:hypothetical protein
MVEATNSRVISGTPRMASMKQTQSIFTAGRLE